MARIIHCHPARTKYGYHIYTDLDFWDTRKILRDIASVRRNFSNDPPGDIFPTQVVANNINRATIKVIEKRLKKAVPSPPRHVIVHAMLFDGFFEFDPTTYYPSHWSRSRMMRFTYQRLPLEQSALCSPYKTIRISWTKEGKIRIERVQRKEKYDPIIRTKKDVIRYRFGPSCF